MRASVALAARFFPAGDWALELPEGVCVAHGAEGALAVASSTCDHTVYLGAAPTRPGRALVVVGSLDGAFRLAEAAAAQRRFPEAVFAVVEGAAHASLGPAKDPHDLLPSADPTEVQQAIQRLVRAFVAGEPSPEEQRFQQLAQPLQAALELEGSGEMGKAVCNSDFPTNPSCPAYGKYPDFALPPGPVKPPNPPIASDCVCGSKWVTDYALPLVSGAKEQGFELAVADAFHSVSDTHPFHLPHIWNECDKPAGCTLNVTTLTENVPGPGTLFPGKPVSALELRSKLKSRTTLYKAAGLTPSPDVDKNYTLCRAANEAAWQWALAHAEPTVKARFDKEGEPFVMVDDKEAPIGMKGPTWIEKELVFTRTKGGVEVQSWTFVVGDSPIHSKYIPSGMHYCKLLSPARAMEWIYTDGLRLKRGGEARDILV